MACAAETMLKDKCEVCFLRWFVGCVALGREDKGNCGAVTE